MNNTEIQTYLDLDKVKEIKTILADKFSLIIQKYRISGDKCFSEIKALLLAQDYDSIRVNIHTLKGSSGNLGAREVYLACMSLEKKLLAKNYENLEEEIQQINTLFFSSASALEKSCDEE